MPKWDSSVVVKRRTEEMKGVQGKFLHSSNADIREGYERPCQTFFWLCCWNYKDCPVAHPSTLIHHLFIVNILSRVPFDFIVNGCRRVMIYNWCYPEEDGFFASGTCSFPLSLLAPSLGGSKYTSGLLKIYTGQSMHFHVLVRLTWWEMNTI